ncbi:MAG: nucleoside triphosphate pyrophosphohydrolase [Polyangiaceae bacterium]
MPRPFAPVDVPPLEEQDGRTFPRLVELMRRLLADDGCPWDREQTFESLRRYVLEEACEVIDAIDGGDRQELCAELGDLSLQVVFQAELARKERVFGPDDVVAAICEKLVRRHPHVFAGVEVGGSEEVLTNWERIKLQEKPDKGLLDGVPRSLPSLVRAQRIGEKVARVGFDWPDSRGSRAKVTEELGELDRALEAGDRANIAAEIGDVLFALVNLSRHLGVDAESALRATNDKFTARFRHVEARVRQEHGGWPKPRMTADSNADAAGAPAAEALSLEVLDRYWDEAKAREAAAAREKSPAQG